MSKQNSRPIKMVLIGTSLGEESDQVVQTGLAVARAASARVFLLHAVQPELMGYEVGAGLDHEREQIARCGEELRRQIARLSPDGPEVASFRVQAGAPHRILTEVAKEIGPDLIVVGATGSGPFAAELLGSTADRVLRKALCPVLVVREGMPVPPRTVLVPVDLSTLSGDTFRCGLHLLTQIAGEEGMEVRAMHALSLLDALAVRQKSGKSVEEVQDSTAREMRRFILENRAEAPFHVETAVIPGEPRAEILQALQEHTVDLLILGTHGRGGMDRLVLGSVASTVVRKAPCSVLVISPEAALAEGISEAILARTEPAWHLEPAAAGAQA